MKKNILLVLSMIGVVVMSSCTKPGSETTTISTPPYQVGQAVSDATPLSGAIKGTMLTGKTYNVSGTVTINPKDTLLIQPGAKVEMGSGTFIVVKGTFLSLGSKDNPIYITSPAGSYKCDINQDPATDPAHLGLWGGIYCDSAATALILKWTHIEFGGGAVKTPSVKGDKAGNAYTIYTVNPNQYIVAEDCWFYGGVDDLIRFQGGKTAFYRNSFINCGAIGGDVLNAKNGTVGDWAYNFFIGCATNGTKASNKGSGGPQANITMYNNTYLQCGYRQIQTGRGGCINYEEGAKGWYANNLMVDCKFGPRIVNNPVADTVNISYGYSFQYGDSLSVVDQFYPTSYITKPMESDIPSFASYLPKGYAPGGTYDGSKLLNQNDPMFVNYSLPQYQHIKFVCPTGSDFHLKAGSPCLGKGNTTTWSPLKLVPVDPKFGVTEYTMPGKDIGCYQADGTGNQHSY